MGLNLSSTKLKKTSLYFIIIIFHFFSFLNDNIQQYLNAIYFEVGSSWGPENAVKIK